MNEKRHEYLLDVRQSVTVTVQTLNELLMYDKIESDTLKVDKTTASVLELMDTIKTFSLSMISASINFSHNIADVEEELSKFVIYGDLHKLNQVLCSILSNAIKCCIKSCTSLFKCLDKIIHTEQIRHI